MTRLCSGLGLRRGGAAGPGRSAVPGRVRGQDLRPPQTDEVSRFRRVTAVEPGGESRPDSDSDLETSSET